MAFRDTALFGVFQLALAALRQLAAAPQPDTKLQDQVPPPHKAGRWLTAAAT